MKRGSPMRRDSLSNGKMRLDRVNSLENKGVRGRVIRWRDEILFL